MHLSLLFVCKLMQSAIEAVAANPELAGSASRPEIAKDCRTHHLFHSRKRAGARGSRVRSPRHFLLYRVTATGVVEIGRLLHDSMDLEAYAKRDVARKVERVASPLISSPLISPMLWLLEAPPI